MAPHSAPNTPPPHVPAILVEESPLTEPIPDLKANDHAAPPATTEERRFSAPTMEWDATQYEKGAYPILIKVLTV